jgi:hypothetical protein
MREPRPLPRIACNAVHVAGWPDLAGLTRPGLALAWPGLAWPWRPGPSPGLSPGFNRIAVRLAPGLHDLWRWLPHYFAILPVGVADLGFWAWSGPRRLLLG